MAHTPHVYFELTEAMTGQLGRDEGTPLWLRHDQIAGWGEGYDHDGRRFTKVWIVGSGHGHLVWESSEEIIEGLRNCHRTLNEANFGSPVREEPQTIPAER